METGLTDVKSFRAMANKEAHQAGYYPFVVRKKPACKEKGFLMSHELSVNIAPKEESPRCFELSLSGSCMSVRHLQLF